MVRVTVPATSANMGSGYDSIGIALEMYNVIDLAENDHIDISIKTVSSSRRTSPTSSTSAPSACTTSAASRSPA